METIIENMWVVIPIVCVLAIVLIILRERKKGSADPSTAAAYFDASGSMTESNKEAIRSSNARRRGRSGLDEEDGIDLEDVFDTVDVALNVGHAISDELREYRETVDQANLNESGREKTGLEISDAESSTYRDTPSYSPPERTYSEPEPVRSSPSYDSGSSSSSYDSGSSDSGGGGGDD